MRLRTSLFHFASASAAPLLVFSLAAAAFAFNQELDSFVATAQARNRAVLAAVDAELLGAVDVLRSLAGTGGIQRDDVGTFFRDEGIEVLTHGAVRSRILSPERFRAWGHDALGWRRP